MREQFKTTTEPLHASTIMKRWDPRPGRPAGQPRLTARMWRLISPLTLCAAMFAVACGYDSSRPCDPDLQAFLPGEEAFPDGTGFDTPNRGVSPESGASPSAVCSTAASIAGGGGAIVNLYRFETLTSAEEGYKNLMGRAQHFNAEYDTPYTAPGISTISFAADRMWIGCSTSKVDADTSCRAVAQYRSHVYWLSLSHLEAAALTEADLAKVMQETEEKLLTYEPHS